MKNILAIAFLVAIVLYSGAAKILSNTIVPKDPKEISPLLDFPVSGKKSSIGSFWGDIRDGGKRKHEGIDIFAKKGTPVVAITDGYVSSVGNGGIGGKTVWLYSYDYGWSAYYAHLDEQMVKSGQFVKKGDILGTVGNTGNARTTPSHLHFGIYTWTGALNPLPYVKNSPKLVLQGSGKSKAVVASSGKSANDTRQIRFSKKGIWKTLKVPADNSGSYYVTAGMDVIRVGGSRTSLIGKWKPLDDSKNVALIQLVSDEKLYVTTANKIINADGEVVASIDT